AVRHRTVSVTPFVLQAFVPWVLCIALSLYSGQSLLQERYFVFGQMSAYSAICAGWPAWRAKAWHFAIVALIGAVHVVGALGADVPYGIQADTLEMSVRTIVSH